MSKTTSAKKTAKKKVAKKTVKKKALAKKATKKAATKKKTAKKSSAKRSADATRKPVKRGKKVAAKPITAAVEYSESTLKKIWLAGVGAYGLSAEALQDTADELREERKAIFDQLVERGAQIQEEANGAVAKKVDEVEGRIEKIKSQLADSYSSSRIALNVEQIAEKLEKISLKKR